MDDSKKSEFKKLFPAKLQLQSFENKGPFLIKLTSTLETNFPGKNHYMVDNALISNCRACFVVKKGFNFSKLKKEDSFSVNGVWYNSHED